MESGDKKVTKCASAVPVRSQRQRSGVMDSFQQELGNTREVSITKEVMSSYPGVRGLVTQSSDAAIRTGMCAHRCSDWGSMHPYNARAFFQLTRESAFKLVRSCQEPEGSGRTHLTWTGQAVRVHHAVKRLQRGQASLGIPGNLCLRMSARYSNGVGVR